MSNVRILSLRFFTFFYCKKVTTATPYKTNVFVLRKWSFSLLASCKFSNRKTFITHAYRMFNVFKMPHDEPWNWKIFSNRLHQCTHTFLINWTLKVLFPGHHHNMIAPYDKHFMINNNHLLKENKASASPDTLSCVSIVIYDCAQDDFNNNRLGSSTGILMHE